MHFWLLEFHLISQSHNFKLFSRARLRHFIKLRQLQYLSDTLIQTEHVHKYSNEFDDQINDELRRMRLVIRHSLSAFFIHQRQLAEPTEDALKEQLNEIVGQVIMRHEQESASKVAEYLRESVQNENLEGFIHRMTIWNAEKINL